MSEEQLEAPQGLPEGEPASVEGAQPEVQETPPEQPEAVVEEEPKPKHKPWFQSRIDELTREKHDERRAREALEERLRKLEQLEPSETPQAGNSEERIREAAAQIVAKERFDQRCNDVYSSGARDFPDFDEKLGQFRHLGGLPPAFLEAVTELPDAHKVLHALGSDLDQAAHIINLPPVQMGLALARLSSPATTARPVSSAPPPIKPIDGAPRGEKSPDDMSMEEWTAWREKTKSPDIQ
jgi:hypothetical protein